MQFTNFNRTRVVQPCRTVELFLHLIILLSAILSAHQAHQYEQTPCPGSCKCGKGSVQCINVGFQFIPLFPVSTRTLVFTGNVIPILSAATLSNLTHLDLVSMDFHNNSIEKVYPDAFFRLGFVEKLILDNNKLTAIPTFCFNTTMLTHLKDLGFSHNLLTSLERDDFNGRCLPNVTSINLSMNLIQYIPDNAFSTLPSLNTLRLEKVNLVYPSEPTTALFAPLAFNSSTLKHLVIPNALHYFFKFHDESTIFQNCPHLTSLNMDFIRLISPTGNELKTLLSPLKKLVNGSFRHSGIETLPVGLFSSMLNLTSLDFKYGKISGWHDETFRNVKSLRYLGFSYNRITTINKTSIPVEVISSLKNIDLSLNPYACTCDLVWFLSFLKSNNNKLIGYPDKYICSTPEKWEKRPLFTYNPSYRECHPLSAYVIMGISMSSGLVVMSLIVIVVYKQRWNIKYHIYLMRARKRGYEKIPDGMDGHLYDAFIAYSHQERKWVISQLIPKVEDEEHFRLCLHDRDFQLGKFIVDNICDEIRLCRKSIVVLSNNFTKSHWCQLELALAQKRHIEEDNGHIIVVLMDEIESKNMSNSVRVLLNSTTYIEWTDDSPGKELFWGRLINALKS